MSNSTLIDFVDLSPNNSGLRKNKISRITIHCYVGMVTCARMGAGFKDPKRKASCNYGVDKYGNIILIVEEKNRSWCSSSAANDNKAITIECASETEPPYTFNNVTYLKLIDLVTDICRRNDKSKLIWIPDKDKALSYKQNPNEMMITLHKWFANKACPGEWFINKLPEFVKAVNSRLQPNTPFKVKTKTILNIRSNAGTNNKIVGQCPIGIYTIIEIKKGVGAKEWYKLKSGAGWIAANYCDIME